MNDAERAHEGKSTTLSFTVEAHDTNRRAPRALVDRESAILQVESNMSSSPSSSLRFLFPVHSCSLACTRSLFLLQHSQ